MPPLRGVNHATEQIERVNAQFDAHCKQVHPGSPLIIGIVRPGPYLA
jgi:hypothetical protein